MGCFLMIIISKKRILLLTSILCISLFICNIALNKTEEKTVQTMALPVTNKVIVIDAGHGVPDEGAQSSKRYNRSSNKFKNSFKTHKTSIPK